MLIFLGHCLLPFNDIVNLETYTDPFIFCFPNFIQQAIACSKLTIETLEQEVKYVQS